VLDGAYVARRLVDLERTLNGEILDELRRGETCAVLPLSPPHAAPSANPPKMSHRPSPARNAGRGA
jgi:hypothetical protein